MKNYIKLLLIGLAIAFVVLIGYIFSFSSPVDDKKYSDCVDAMNEAIPDPNDEGRPNFLKNCYESE